MFGSVEYPNSDGNVERSDMFCPKCDGRIEGSDSFCPHCGYEIPGNLEAEDNSKADDVVGGLIRIAVVLIIIFVAVTVIKYALG